jgi:hypothetical protein
MMTRGIAANLIRQINQTNDIDIIQLIIQPYEDVLTDSILQSIFEKISEVDKKGLGKVWLISDLISISKKFQTTNGLAWARSDGSLGKKYLIDRVKKNNRSYSVQLVGFNLQATERYIPQSVRSHFANAVCALTGTSEQIEIDHKDGRYLQHYTEPQDFQPLHRNINLIKRQHCKKCKETNLRFDAKQLGFNKSYIMGDDKWKMPLGCRGCFWFDIHEFRKEVK